MQIIWSDDAISDYYKTIEYLLQKWSESTAKNFIEEVDSVLEMLLIQPDLYPLTDYPKVRKAVIRKQITLFYSFEGSEIVLIRFWNTYQNPKKLKL